jgi:hypothetical protein
VSELAQLESLLASGDHVRLTRRQAHDVVQKLRARGGASEAADRIETQLGQSDQVELVPGDAAELLEELRASGRRWISGTDAPRERETPRAARPEPEPEPEPERQGWFGRLFGR